jgi:hypothetical protein
MGRLGWVLAGALVCYILLPNREWSYPEVIVPAARILEREVPGEIRWRDRIVYVYLAPDVRAVAPGGATEDVARFCRPVVVADSGQTRTDRPVPSVIRTVSWTPSIVPLRKGALLVTSMTGYGDLVAEDYTARAPFGIAAGLDEPYRTVVRYSRLAPVREVAGGLLWYVGFCALEAVVRCRYGSSAMGDKCRGRGALGCGEYRDQHPNQREQDDEGKATRSVPAATRV